MVSTVSVARETAATNDGNVVKPSIEQTFEANEKRFVRPPLNGTGTTRTDFTRTLMPAQSAVGKRRTPKRDVRVGEVRAKLDMDGPQRVIKMGYSPQLVGAVIAEQLIFEGKDFGSHRLLVMAVVEADKMGSAFPRDHYELGLNSSADNGSTDKTPTPEYVRTLEAENELLKTTKLCTVCLDNIRDVLFAPCAHVVACHTCTTRLKKCVLCRARIKGIVKVYLP